MASRNFIFVINNPDEEIFEKIKSVGKGVAMQIETGRQGTRHIQGYVEFDRPTTYAQARFALGGFPHIEKRKGTRSQAIEYSLKTDTRSGESFCNLPRNSQGRRSDILLLKKDLDEGMSMDELYDNHFSCCLRYDRGIAAYRLFKRSNKWRTVRVEVFYGPTGTGKTRAAWAQYPELFDVLPPTKDNVWFNGYYGQGTLLIDEFYGNMPWGLFLRILDGHPTKVEFKGGVIAPNWSTVIITTNSHPSIWYNYGDKMQYTSLERRISEIINFN